MIEFINNNRLEAQSEFQFAATKMSVQSHS